MDIFNRKKVSLLESKITELEGELRRANELRPTVYVNRGDALPLVVAIHMSDGDMNVPVEILKQRLCRKLADEMFKREVVRYEMTDDPRTMSHIMHARIDVVHRG